LTEEGPAEPPLRVLVAKVGLDGHDRGARVVARALRDDGMEVVYTGRHVRPEVIAATARDEDVDIVGLSILSGAHAALTRAVLDAMEAAGVRDEIAVVVGGTVSTERLRDELLEIGVADVFPGATPLPEVVRRVRALGEARRAAHTSGAGSSEGLGSPGPVRS
jgi:methylmalonyl-CoA mutase C-terminal domain/subunit